MYSDTGDDGPVVVLPHPHTHPQILRGFLLHINIHCVLRGDLKHERRQSHEAPNQPDPTFEAGVRDDDGGPECRRGRQ